MTDQELKVFSYLLEEMTASQRADFEADLRRDPNLQRALEEASELLLGDETTSSPGPSTVTRRAVLESTKSQDTFTGFARRLASMFEISPEEAQSALDQIRNVPALPWRPFMTDGAFLLPITVGAHSSSQLRALVYLRAGTRIPMHRHDGEERMLLVAGYAEDDSGRLVCPGDEVVSAPGSQHSFTLQTDLACVFALRVSGNVEFVA
ncbi:MAG: hypothetical protein K0U93_20050 [Gammaproteobacteria bacterium]|nr:hypothetical protein [Gammaproteobacteria bacterium]